MKIIARYWKMFLYFLVTGSTSVFIAACYGMPAGFGNLASWTVKTNDENDHPIEGLEVTVLRYAANSNEPDTLDRAQTDSTGTAMFGITIFEDEVDHRHEAAIRDIDGEQNGGFFADTTITRGDTEESVVRMKRTR